MAKIKKPWNPNRYVANALRRIWRWSPQRRQIKNEVRSCVSCSKRLNSKTVKVDHITPVGSVPKVFDGWDGYFARLFCPATGLQGLCKACHQIKTNKENAARRALKRGAANDK